jgi:hypothetical protein
MPKMFMAASYYSKTARGSQPGKKAAIFILHRFKAAHRLLP